MAVNRLGKLVLALAACAASTAWAAPQYRYRVALPLATEKTPAESSGGNNPPVTPVEEAVPVLSSLAPGVQLFAAGSQRTVSLTGTGFDAQTVVNVGSSVVAPTVLSATALNFFVPMSTPVGSHSVTVERASGKASNSVGTLSVLATPTLAQVTPAEGQENHTLPVVLAGAGFNSANVTAVLFGGTPGTNVQRQSDGSLSVTAPALPAGDVAVQVRLSDAFNNEVTTSTGAVSFRYLKTEPGGAVTDYMSGFGRIASFLFYDAPGARVCAWATGSSGYGYCPHFPAEAALGSYGRDPTYGTATSGCPRAVSPPRRWTAGA